MVSFYYFIVFVFVCVTGEESGESNNNGVFQNMQSEWTNLENGEKVLFSVVFVVSILALCTCCCVRCQSCTPKKKEEIANLKVRISTPTHNFPAVPYPHSVKRHHNSRRLTTTVSDSEERWHFPSPVGSGSGNTGEASPVEYGLPKIIDESSLRRQISKENPSLPPEQRACFSPMSTNTFLGSPQWNLRGRMSTNAMTPGQYVDALDHALLQEEAEMFADLEEDIQTSPSSSRHRITISSPTEHA